jgi:hypothetical protein
MIDRDLSPVSRFDFERRSIPSSDIKTGLLRRAPPSQPTIVVDSISRSDLCRAPKCDSKAHRND